MDQIWEFADTIFIFRKFKFNVESTNINIILYYYTLHYIVLYRIRFVCFCL